MKKWIFASFVAFLPFVIQAQSLSNYEEVVYLKNGSIYRGIIIEQTPNQSLKIQSADRNVYAVPISEVEKITKEEKPRNLYRNRSLEGNSFEKPSLDTPKERKPEHVRYSGFYMNWALGAGSASGTGGGLAFEMRLGGKIFSKKSLSRKVKIGGDISIFGGVMGFPGSAAVGMTGINGGVSIAFKPSRGIIYLTPYLGLNLAHSNRNDITYYDQYGNYYPNHVSNTNISLPVGFKFEYNIKRFLAGAFVEAGGALERNHDSWSTYNSFGAAGKIGLLVGVKF